MIKFLVGALAASLIVLGGCTLPTGADNDVFESACRNGPTAHLAFTIYANNSDVSPVTIQREQDAYRVLMSACSNPNPDKVVAGLEAYAEILASRN